MSDFEEFSATKLKKLRARLESSLVDVLDQAKKAEGQLKEVQARLAKLDKESARSELLKLRGRLQGEVERVSKDFGINTQKLRAELEKTRVRVQDTLESVKTQVKAIAAAERSKRRGRSRSE